MGLRISENQKMDAAPSSGTGYPPVDGNLLKIVKNGKEIKENDTEIPPATFPPPLFPVIPPVQRE